MTRDINSSGAFDNDEYFYYRTDGLGSITELTTGVGTAPVQSYVYDSFGNIVQQTGTIPNPYTFTGREYDAESGLYYFRARYYDPTIGRFLQEDPIGMEDSPNLYQFVLNNPTNWIDPYGTDVWIEGYSGEEPWLHQSINVGDPSGEYISYSFGWDYGNFNWEYGMVGVVYIDTEIGGKINNNYYLKTTHLEDMEVKSFLNTMVGDEAAYVPFGSNCRDFSQSAFNTIKKAGIGKKSKLPRKRKK